MKKIVIFFLFNILGELVYGQMGINTTNPQATLHVNGSFQFTKELSLGGNATTPGDSAIVGAILNSNGAGKAPSWSKFKIPDSSDKTGTVIAVNGDFVIAQEIAVQLTSDYNFSPPTRAVSIPNLSTILIDNENAYTSNASGNHFTIKEKGIYEVTMSFVLQNATKDNVPVIGIWDDTDNDWIARINDAFNVSTTGPAIRNQTYTLFTTVDLVPAHTYSFRTSNTASFTLKSKSSDSSGSVNVSTAVVKRLK